MIIKKKDNNNNYYYYNIYEGCPSKSWTLQIYQKPNVAEL